MPTPKTKPTQIFLVDDHPLVREGLIQCLQQEEGFTVCGHAGTTKDALRAIKAMPPPDLVLVDIALPGRDGLELIKDLNALLPACPCVVLSMFEEQLYAERALRAGACGYVMKHEPPERLIQVLHRVLKGEVVASPAIVQRALKRNARQPLPPQEGLERELTDREMEVYRMIGSGKRRSMIAKQLNMGVKTFETHRANIRKKLEFKDVGTLLLHASQFVRDSAKTAPLTTSTKS